MPQRGTQKLLGRLVLLCAFLCIAVADVDAASLFGKVIEVNSGDVITVFNLNRPVRVRLLGVDAPELDQTFGDVAKKHLADLIYDKSVTVEYSGIDGDHSVNGQVSLEGVDIGAQMIRDGVAWLDPSNQYRLNATDRAVYQESEAAARSERRGLWQQENPVAPWEFARALAMRRAPAATLNAVVAPVKRPAPDRPTPELNSLTLIASRVAAAVPSSNVNSPALPEGFLAPVDGGNWKVLRPAGERFSALVPEGEMQDLPDKNGIKDVHLYRGRDGRASFVVLWLTGPTYGESDADAIREGTDSFTKVFGQETAFGCESMQNDKDISMGGFTGLEFEFKCRVPLKTRVFTRIINGDRQVYMAMVLYREKDDNIDRFINSFTITEARPPKGTKGAKTR
jgi:micrococcal nuclease